MKILKKYANGGSTKGDGTPRKPIHVRKPKERGNPFNTGTGSKYRKLADKMKKRQGPARGGYTFHEMKGRKYMGGGKMKEYANGGTEPHNSFDMRRNRKNKKRERLTGGSTEPHNSFDMRRERKKRISERKKRLTGGSTEPHNSFEMRNGMSKRQQARPGGGSKRPGGIRSNKRRFENGGTNPEKRMTKTVSKLKKKREGRRFDKKFARKRKQYDKDVSKGRTTEAPHERTFKFRKKGESVFSKRGKYTVELGPEARKRRMKQAAQDVRQEAKMPDVSRPPRESRPNREIKRQMEEKSTR